MESALGIFNSVKEYVFYPQGSIIFKEGQYGNEMFVLVTGQVDIQIQGKTVNVIERGGIFGEMGLVDSGPRSGTAIAITDCKVIPINEKRFQYLVQNTPFFALQVMKIMAERLRKMNQIYNQYDK